MRIINRRLLDNFTTKHADATKPIERWIGYIENSNISNHNDLKMVFPSADYVGKSRYVFNIKGNDYRLVVVVVFMDNNAFVRFAGTHAEYNKIDCVTI